MTAPTTKGRVVSRAPWNQPGSGLLVAVGLVVAAAAGTGASDSLRLLMLAGSVIALSVPRGRTRIERRLARAAPGRLGADRKETLFDLRTLLGPPLCIVVGVLCGIIHADRIDGVVKDKFPIIAFIMAFAYLCEGVSESGYFEYASRTIAAKCRGNTSRLIVYMFLLSSVFAVITSNDIVVLSLTPITLAIAREARIKNARLLLLSQFIAANTLSMAFFTGSPTNIIVSEQLNVDFFSYMLIMAVPSAVALFATLGGITLVNYASEEGADKAERSAPGGRRHPWWRRRLNGAGRWQFSRTYDSSRELLPPKRQPEMRAWVGAFWVSITFVALASLFNPPGFLLLSAGAALLSALIAYHRTFRPGSSWVARRRTGSERISRRSLALHLPYAIPPFALAMFVITDALSQTAFADWLQTALVDLSDHSFLATAFSWGGVTGILVNVLNDLPTSDLLAQLFDRLPFTFVQQYAALQAMLVTMNIGTYLTPVGALAGLIWLQTLRRDQSGRDQPDDVHRGQIGEPKRANIEVPELRDLLTYGGIIFVITFVFSMVSIALLGIILNYLVSGKNAVTRAGDQIRPPTSPQINIGWVEMLCLVAALSVLFLAGRWFVREVRRLDVVVTHFTDLFRGLTVIRRFSQKHPKVFSATLSLFFIFLLGAAIYGIESLHSLIYGTPFFVNGLGGFLRWIVVFPITDEFFPNSVGGGLLTAVLFASTVGMLVYFFRVLPQRVTTLRVKQLLAHSAEHRFFVLNCSREAIEFVAVVHEHDDAMVVAVPRPGLHESLEVQPEFDAASVVLLDRPPLWESFADEYRLVEARLVVFELSSGQLELHEAFVFLSAYAHHVAKQDPVPREPAAVVILVPDSATAGIVMTAARRSKMDPRYFSVLAFAEDVEEFLAADVAGDEELLSRFYPDVVEALGGAGIDIDGPSATMRFRRRALPTSSDPMQTLMEIGENGLSRYGQDRHPASAHQVVVVGLSSDYGGARSYVPLFWARRLNPDELAVSGALVVTDVDDQGHEAPDRRPPARVVLAFAEDAAESIRRAIIEASPGVQVGLVDLPAGGISEDQVESIVANLAKAVVEANDPDDDDLPIERALSRGDRLLVFRPSGESRSAAVRTRFVSALALERARNRDPSSEDVTVVVESSLRNRRLDLESFEVDGVFDSNLAKASFFRTVGLILDAHVLDVAPEDRDEVVRSAVNVGRALRRYWIEPLVPGLGRAEICRTLVCRDARPVMPIGHLELRWHRQAKRFRGAFRLGLDPLLERPVGTAQQAEEEGVHRYVVCLAQL